MVLLFIFGAAEAINPANWHPFIPPNAGKWGDFGWSGVMRGASLVFFAYIGFDAVSTAAQEAKNPQRDMPIGIIGSLLVCTVLYILVSGIATGVVPYRELDVPEPIALAADHANMGWMASVIKLGAIAGLSSVILVMMLGQTRVFWSMSRDGLLPPFVSRVHPRFQNAVAHHHCHRRRGGLFFAPSCRCGTPGICATSARCWRLSSCPSASWCCGCASRIAAEVPDAVGLVRRADGRAFGLRADVCICR